MPPDLKKKTVRISFDQRSRSTALLRALVRSDYFDDPLPSEVDLSRKMHLPRSYISYAFSQCEAQGLIERAAPASPWKRAHQEQHNGEVALVVNTDPLEGWQSVFLDFFIGFEEIMRTESYQARLVGNFSTPQDKVDTIASLREKGYMGFAMASRVERPVLDLLQNQSIPAVVIGNATMEEEQFGCVCTDNPAGVRKAIEFLVSLGHETIGFYGTGLSFHNGFRIRFEHYLAEMRRHHLNPVKDLAYLEPHSDLSSTRAAETLMRKAQKPTAIFCASDREAFELCSDLKHRGVEIPHDVSIMGFDNNYYAQLLNPPITTVDIYAVNMGQIAAHYLLNEMLAPQIPVKISLPTEIIQRGSVKELRKTVRIPDPGSDPSGLLTF